ncbi:tudor domain-containing protein 3 [Phtheirospermum japonicum]|uniref:Tudor domain-containing protein 3 n=1 Tax=Phtheirospermum japonicum TaxID=374723 RepID=A0A830DFD1_9LAMI|nr:tudor domain-containing protein 3 [Phtheirospermum japonicum]
MDASPSSSSSNSLLLQALISRGWRFKDLGQIGGLITAQQSVCTVDSIESELLNMDLRSIGGKCLPEPSILCRTSHLQGPIVLQVCSSRDISRSCIADASGNSGNRRLLQLKLTDGHSEITAVERLHIPSIPDDVSPGTKRLPCGSTWEHTLSKFKVRLQGKADIYSGILCLNIKAITILGGVVQSLYEEWQLKRKYIDVTRYSLRLSQENPSNSPPPFEKLQIRVSAQGTTSIFFTSANKGTDHSSDTTGFFGASSNDCEQTLAAKGESSKLSHTVQLQKNKSTMDSVADDVKLLHAVGENTENPTCSSARPKGGSSNVCAMKNALHDFVVFISSKALVEINYKVVISGTYTASNTSVCTTVTASVPVQNQVSAQKLLQKTSQPDFKDRKSRSQRHRGKAKEEDSSLITLDEWERRKTGIDLVATHEHSNISQDEDLARQLQKQFELEDIYAQNGPHVVDAKSIKMSMFNFEREDARAAPRRGQGRGRQRRIGSRRVQP